MVDDRLGGGLPGVGATLGGLAGTVAVPPPPEDVLRQQQVTFQQVFEARRTINQARTQQEIIERQAHFQRLMAQPGQIQVAPGCNIEIRRPETREQMIERHVLELQAWDQDQERRENSAKADKKAWALFKSHLTQDQLITCHANFIIVHGKSGSRYRLWTDRLSFNIDEIKWDGQKINTYCAFPMGIPTGDIYLTQKLWLESDDEGFKKQANDLNGGVGMPVPNGIWDMGAVFGRTL